MHQRLLMNLVLGVGGEIGFSHGDVSHFLDSVETLKPTLFSAVPAVLNSLYDNITSGVESSGPLTTAFFNMAVKGKKKNLQGGKLDHYLYDRLVFKKIRTSFGGRVRALFTGVGPVSFEGFPSPFFCPRMGDPD